MSMDGDDYWHQAFRWLCLRRKLAPPNADVWDLRWRWGAESQTLFKRVNSGGYRLSPMQIHGRGKHAVAMWSAMDALVLKWISLHVQHQLPRPKACMHLTGRGVRKSIEEVSSALASGAYHFVHRTDIKGYYQHMLKNQIMNQVEEYVTDPNKVELIRQYTEYCVDDGGEIHTPTRGIPRGCALSPMIGGSLLCHVDDYFSSLPRESVFYTRYMDDFLIFTRTRWQLRRVIQQLCSYFDANGFQRHPEKTQTGRINRGFDWLGLWFSSEGVDIAPRATNNYRERRLRLFEQARRRGLTRQATLARVQAYEEKWEQWAAGLMRRALDPDARTAGPVSSSNCVTRVCAR